MSVILSRPFLHQVLARPEGLITTKPEKEGQTMRRVHKEDP
ncbi:hypothetical protein QF036_003387 [Arthrobacter globiformis]|nr:hypothetical protein [Arthrobacter globiformis]